MTDYEAVCIELADNGDQADYSSIRSIGLQGAHDQVFTVSPERVCMALSEEDVSVSFTIDGTTFKLEPVPRHERIRTKGSNPDTDPLFQLPQC